MQLSSLRKAALSNETVSSAYIGHDKALERIATGRRINDAADDLAGFGQEVRLKSEITALSKNIFNAMTTQNFIDVADRSLGSMANLALRLRELSIQYKNDALNESDKIAVLDEAAMILSELDAIQESTNWAGIGVYHDADFNIVGQVDGEIVLKSTGASFKDHINALRETSHVYWAKGSKNGDGTISLHSDGISAAISADISLEFEGAAGFENIDLGLGLQKIHISEGGSLKLTIDQKRDSDLLVLAQVDNPSDVSSYIQLDRDFEIVESAGLKTNEQLDKFSETISWRQNVLRNGGFEQDSSTWVTGPGIQVGSLARFFEENEGVGIDNIPGWSSIPTNSGSVGNFEIHGLVQDPFLEIGGLVSSGSPLANPHIVQAFDNSIGGERQFSFDVGFVPDRAATSDFSLVHNGQVIANVDFDSDGTFRLNSLIGDQLSFEIADPLRNYQGENLSWSRVILDLSESLPVTNSIGFMSGPLVNGAVNPLQQNDDWGATIDNVEFCEYFSATVTGLPAIGEKISVKVEPERDEESSNLSISWYRDGELALDVQGGEFDVKLSDLNRTVSASVVIVNQDGTTRSLALPSLKISPLVNGVMGRDGFALFRLPASTESVSFDLAVPGGRAALLFGTVSNLPRCVRDPSSLDDFLDSISSARGNFAAVSRRLEHFVTQSTEHRLSLEIGFGGIVDADIAQETESLSKSNILMATSIEAIRALHKAYSSLSIFFK